MKVGEELEGKGLEVDRQGRSRLSRKVLLDAPAPKEEATAEAAPEATAETPSESGEPPQKKAPLVDDAVLAAAFGEVVDAKSPYTGGHSSRVAEYTDAIGTTLGLAPERKRWLHRGALLHDVGKLGVSSLVLEKPGKLDDGEWVEMRGHADATRDILGRIECFRDLADAAAAHHERLDGKGYPLGLKQQELSRETRIISVCDFYDALTADRPYRAAMPQEKAIAIIEGEVGKAVDGDCFEALKIAVNA